MNKLQEKNTEGLWRKSARVTKVITNQWDTTFGNWKLKIFETCGNGKENRCGRTSEHGSNDDK